MSTKSALRYLHLIFVFWFIFLFTCTSTSTTAQSIQSQVKHHVVFVALVNTTNKGRLECGCTHYHLLLVGKGTREPKIGYKALSFFGFQLRDPQDEYIIACSMPKVYETLLIKFSRFDKSDWCALFWFDCWWYTSLSFIP